MNSHKHTSKLPMILDTKLSSSAFVIWLGKELVVKEFDEFIDVLLERSEILE
jgi:hypothetical protein